MDQAITLIGKGDKEKGEILREKLQKQIIRVLRANMPPDRFMALALREISQSPKLSECSTLSVCASIVESAILGLEISSVTGQAYLVPFGRECQLIVGYKGLALLAWRGANILTTAEIVYENDVFSVERGSNPKIIHKPLTTGERGKLIGAYAVFTYPDGRTVQEWMDVKQIEKIRLRSKAKDNGPWKTDYEAMARKCPIRSGAKFLPVDAAPELNLAAARDELREFGVGGVPEPEAVQAAEEITGETTPEPVMPEPVKQEKGMEALKARLTNDRLINQNEVDDIQAALDEHKVAPMAWTAKLSELGARSQQDLKLSQLPEVHKWIRGAK